MKKNKFFIFIVLFAISLPFTYGGCFSGGGGGDGGDQADNSEVAIEWLDPYPGASDPVITYRYSGGVLVGMLFYKDFAVLRNSGTVEITATVEDGSAPPGIFDEHTEYFDVTEGIEYEVIVDVATGNWRNCSALDRDYMIFSSPPSTSSTSDIMITPLFVHDPPNPDFHKCAGTYTIREIRINPGSVRFYNNLVCGIDSFWADLDICGTALDSDSGSWSSCETVMPGTCSWQLSANPAGCTPLNLSGTIDLDSDCVYSFVLELDNNEVVLSIIDECPGNCNTPEPDPSGASSKSVIELQIEGEGFTSAQ